MSTFRIELLAEGLTMIVSISSHKGGTGKTTSAVSLASAFSINGKKVLLVDSDPQGNLSYSLELNYQSGGLSEAYLGRSIRELIIQKEGFHVVTASMELADIELSLQSADERTTFLRDILEDVKFDYDVIIIDCPPSRSLLTINALVASDYVLSPILLDVLSIQGLIHLVKTIADVRMTFNNRLRFLGIVAVNVDLRKRIAREVLELIQSKIDYPFFETLIRTNIKLTEAPSHGCSVHAYDPESTGAIDYTALSKEIETKILAYGTGKEFETRSAYSA